MLASSAVKMGRASMVWSCEPCSRDEGEGIDYELCGSCKRFGEGESRIE